MLYYFQYFCVFFCEYVILKNFLCVDRAEKTGVYLLKRGRKMKKAVVAGNSLTDVIKRIEQYPEKGMLAKITEVVPGVGGCVPNTAISLKTLAPRELDVSALSRIGKDENGEFILKTLSRHGVRTDKMRIDPVLPTSFTDVMTLPNGERTFFCAAAANAAFGEEDIAADALECDLFHIGYLLLLEKLDAPDEEYGTKMARLLHGIRERGIRTSVDCVSAEGSRFSEVVRPALPYCDYIVVNEIEAGNIAGMPLRGGNGIIRENFRAACEELFRAGVQTAVAIHCPGFGCLMNAAGEYTEVPSLELPKGYIAGAVGAGDAFCAGMLYSFLEGMSAEEGLRLASCAAARNASVPVCVHLDHGVTMKMVCRALRLGFTSVMIDTSALPFEENLRVTKEVTRIAHDMGADVEAELGRLVTGEDGKKETDADPSEFYTRADEAAHFARETGIDALAVAFGTSHGFYKAQPKLDFRVVRDCAAATGLPLVMHGGSGVSDEGFRKAIEAGIRKINYYSYMSKAGYDAAAAAIASQKYKYLHDVEYAAMQAMKEDVKRAISVFSGI